MGNQVYVQSTIFVSVPQPVKDEYEDNELSITYGFRIFDDEGRDYDNNFGKESWKKIREEGLEAVLNHIADFSTAEGNAIASFALSSKKCAYFDGVWTELPGYWEQATHTAPKDEEEIE